jgi:hypothetical protein
MIMGKPVRPRLAAGSRPPRRVQLRVESLEERSVPAVDTVLNLNASGAGSLSAVLAAASSGDTIVFAPGLSGTITPSSTLTVANSVTIEGPGADVISISGGGVNQVFKINNGVSSAISGLTITDGLVSSSTGNVAGGAIDNEGNLALVGDVISNSTASAAGAGHTARGGGIFSNGALSLINCTVSGNTATATGGSTAQTGLFLNGALGGGIDSEGPVLSVSGCVFTGDHAVSASGGAFGGGLFDESPTDSIVNTDFTANTASVTTGSGTTVRGGGYFNLGDSTTTFTNLTFSGNSATSSGTGPVFGGGFAYEGTLGTFTNVDVTGNTASSAGGNDVVAGGGAFVNEPVDWTGGLVSGNSATSSGSVVVAGGGIFIGGRATLTGLTVTDNSAGNTGGGGDVQGGGIFSDGWTEVGACTVSGNHLTADSGSAQGGGIWNDFELTVTASTIADNSTDSNTNNAEGGGIWNSRNLTVTAGTIANNSASSSTGDADGGGIWNSSNLAVTNTTLFGNRVTATAGTAEGGGLLNGTTATATLLNDTLASNTATGATAKGGGISNHSTLNLANTIVYDPNGAADPDVSGSLTATQNSLYGSAVAAQIAANGNLGGNQFSVNPLLGPLAFNGGPTQTMALLPGSPALGAGTSTSALGGIPSTDQRGLPRPGPDGFDLGAFQTQPPPQTPLLQPQADPSMPPQVMAFLVPATRGQIAVSGFVLDPSGLLDGLPLVVVINWGDGTTTFTGLFTGPGGFDFFLPQRHHKPKGHKPVTVHVQQFVPGAAGLVDVVPPFTVAT